MSTIPNDKHTLLILGDFNIDLNKPQLLWESTFTQHGLDQLIKENTRVNPTSQTLIDHIYTNDKDHIKDSKVIKINFSDHYAIYLSYLKKTEKRHINKHTLIKYRCYKKFDVKSFTAELSQIPFNTVYNINDPNTALTHLCNMMTAVIDKHAPLKTKRVKHHDIPPWLSQETLKEMEIRDMFQEKNDAFKKQRNKVNAMVAKDKKTYFDKLLTNKKDTATIWKAMNNITNSNRRKPNSQNIQLDPNTINDFFINLPNTILPHNTRTTNVNYECPPKLLNHCNNSKTGFKVPYLTVMDVGKLISSLKNSKTLGPENIPVYIFKISLPFIVEELTYIYNLCIDKCTFPIKLKEAKVIPLPKTKDTTQPQNLRPISLLPVLSKPLERHIHKHMYSHLNEQNLLHQYQSGFRPHHSCHTALTRLIDSWYTAINKKQLIGSLFIDFKKAFDLVNHNTLLKKLTVYFPKSPIIKLINSYLTERQQFVYLNGNKSQTKRITAGVPQGSVLGPLFFLIYINDLPLHINHNTHTDLFADDASLHTAHTKTETIENYLQDSINKAHNWCEYNSMVIHPDKTKCMLMTTRQKNQRTNTTLTLTFGNKQIEQVHNHKMLGLSIDSHLTWNIHIESIIKRVSKNFFLLTKLKKYASIDNLKLYFDAHIMSHINYASTIHDGCTKDMFNGINAVHRKAIRLLHNIGLREELTQNHFKSLGILPLEKQYQLNKSVLIHKIYYGKTPSYLNKLIEKTTDRYGSKNLKLPLCRIDLTQKSLAFSGSQIWNALPIDLKNTSSSTAFKNKLHKLLIET